MKKHEYKKLFKELLPEVTAYLNKYSFNAMKSGAFELKNEEADFSIPKTVMHVALLKAAEQFKPLDSKLKELSHEINNKTYTEGL